MQINTSTTQLRNYLETKQGRTYFIAILTMVTVAVMLVFAIAPAVTSITNKLAQNKVRREYLNALTSKEENIKKLLLQEEGAQSHIQFLDSSFPNKRNDEFVLANIAEMATRTNNTIASVDFGDEEVPKISTNSQQSTFLRQVPITLSIQGTVVSLSEIVKKIEEFPMPFAIESMSFSNKSIQNLNLSGENGDTVLTLKIRYYYYNDVTE